MSETQRPTARSARWLARLDDFVFLTSVLTWDAYRAACYLGVTERTMERWRAHLKANPRLLAYYREPGPADWWYPQPGQDRRPRDRSHRSRAAA